MNKYKLLTFGIICIALSGLTLSWVGKNKAFQSSLNEQIVGEWRNISVKVVMHTYHKTNETVVMEADSSNWGSRLHIKPIRTHFQANGTYYSEYRNLKDSIMRRPTGTWVIKGDSIIMNQLTPEKNESRLRVKINKNVATFKGWIDFDADGSADDEYTGVQRKY